MIKMGISRYLSVAVTTAVVAVTMVRVWQVMMKDHECEMTWMFERVNYTKIHLPSEVQELYPTYGLYFYGEGLYAKVYSRIPLQGIPVLFIPGNRGSYKQVRSAASIALRMSGKEFPRLNHFNFFTVDLNEEFSGVFGGTLWHQTTYVQHCISHILMLYSHLPHPPATVTILAHSMGGVVARALFSLDTFNASLVNLIITMATPHARPVAYSDILLYSFYQSMDETWNTVRVDHVTLVSIAAGDKDLQVPRHLTLPNANRAYGQMLTYLSQSVPRHWKSSDHQAIVWCRRLQLSLARALFNLQRNNSFDLDAKKYKIVFNHWLSSPSLRDLTDINKLPRVTVDSKWSWSFQSNDHRDVFLNFLENDSITEEKKGLKELDFVAYALSEWSNRWQMVTIVNNMYADQWIILCHITSDDKILSDCRDASRYSLRLPPVYRTTRVLVLPLEMYKNYTALVLKPRTSDFRLTATKKTKHIKPYSFVNFHNHSIEVVSLPNVLSGPSVVKLVAGCPISYLNLEAIDSSLPPWSQLYQVSMTFSNGNAKMATPFVLSVGPYIDGISQGFHSISGSLPLTIKFDMKFETQYQEAYILIWNGHAINIEVVIEYDLVGVISKVVCDCLLDLIWWCLVASVIRATLLCSSVCNPTLAVSVVFLAFNYPVVMSSVTGSMIARIIPFSASTLVLIIFLTVLITGVNHIVELGIGVLLMLAHRLIRRHEYCSDSLAKLSFPCSIFTCGSVAVLILFISSLCKVTSKDTVFLVPLFWIQVITSPALLAWIHALTNGMFLSPDPHFIFSLLALFMFNTTL